MRWGAPSSACSSAMAAELVPQPATVHSRAAKPAAIARPRPRVQPVITASLGLGMGGVSGNEGPELLRGGQVLGPEEAAANFSDEEQGAGN